jgi:uncharacterized protein
MKTLDCEGRSELHYAARDGDLSAVEKLVSAGADVNLQDTHGWSPLHFAAQASAADVAVFLIARGASIDPEDSFGNTPLSRATFNSRGGGDVICVLRNAGADPKKKNKTGVSPLSLARSIANFNVAQFFDDLPDP